MHCCDFFCFLSFFFWFAVNPFFLRYLLLFNHYNFLQSGFNYLFFISFLKK